METQTAPKRVLVVDDEPHILDGLKRALHGHVDGWSMVFAESAEAARQAFGETVFDVAVVDVNMPGGSGLDLLQWIKSNERTSETEVVILTGLKDRDLKRRALDLGATDLLAKPVVTEDLVARITSALRAREQRGQLRAQQARLEEALVRSQRMEVVGTLAAGLTHDLKTMLTVLLGYGELTERMLPGDTKAHSNIGQMLTAGRRAKAIVAQITRLARGGETEPKPCDLAAVVSECIELIRPVVANTVDVVWEPPAACGLVTADETQLCQVVMNLCLNAAQAMQHGGILTVTLSAPADGGVVRLTVRDTGVGLDEATRRHIFEPLFSTKRKRGGSGLGLAVVQRLVTAWSGTISVTSALGEGTSFEVVLPVAETASQSAPRPEEFSHAGE
jgi:signal transduction histidine kinase